MPHNHLTCPRTTDILEYQYTDCCCNKIGCKPLQQLAKIRRAIGAAVRRLRQDRRWSQKELARQLDLSQPRLSQIERGEGSFTAEQLVTILRLFNVTLDEVAPAGPEHKEVELQNALARLGAVHLHEDERASPRQQLADPNIAVREALATGSPRLTTALAPVLVHNVDEINLDKLGAKLADSGLERRFGWLLENVVAAIREELPSVHVRRQANQYRRAVFVIDTYLGAKPSTTISASDAAAPDLLDREIRSKATLERTRESSSFISRRWGIVTRIQPEDFARALRATDGRN